MHRTHAFRSILAFLLVSSLAASTAAQVRRTAQRPRALTTLSSDQIEYLVGNTALLTGSGFVPGDRITLRAHRVDGTPIGLDNLPWSVTADAFGSFLTAWAPLESASIGAPLFVTARADDSGLGAHTSLSFNHDCGTGVVLSVTPVGASCADFTMAQGNGPDNYEVEEGGTYVMTIAGVTECTGDTITVFIQSSNTGNFCFDATGGNGAYVGTFTMPDPACHTFPISYKCGAGAECSHAGSFKAQGLTSGCGGAHLRASEFDGSCNRTGTDETCSSVCIEETMDFELDACGDATFMGHGLDLETAGPECGFVCPLITSGPDDGNGNAGAALFDTETSGGSQDPDLQAAPAGQGNVLIVQNNATAGVLAKTGVNGPDTYDHPNDDQDGGRLTFDFCAPVRVDSIDLLDIDTPTPGQDASVVLTDSGGFTRTYTVPGGWTPDGGVATLNLLGLDQLGPGGAIATVATQAGYDETQVVRVEVTFGSSGALDNLSWCE